MALSGASGGFLKAKGNGNREAKSTSGNRGGIALFLPHRVGAALDRPSQLAEGLLERPAFEAAQNEKFGGLNQVFLGFGGCLSLRRDIERGAMRNIPAALLLESSKETPPMRFSVDSRP